MKLTDENNSFHIPPNVIYALKTPNIPVKTGLTCYIHTLQKTFREELKELRVLS